MWSLITVLSSDQELQVAEGRYRAAHSKEQGKLTEVCSSHCRDLYILVSLTICVSGEECVGEMHFPLLVTLPQPPFFLLKLDREG